MAKVEESADAVRTRRALENAEVIRDFAETTHRAKSWSRERRVIARIEATRLGLDVRFILTNLTLKCPRTVYEMLYCALASDRTSCRRLEANQVRLVLHTAAYWLLLTLRDAIPTIRDLERVRNDPAAPSQNRCAGAGNRKPHPPRLCGKAARRPPSSGVSPARWQSNPAAHRRSDWAQKSPISPKPLPPTCLPSSDPICANSAKDRPAARNHQPW